jgi:RNA polymerase sigma-70 factor (ECF subfamily)
LTDEDLADRAQYLARVLHTIRPTSPDLAGLLALILFTRARSGGRWDGEGQQVQLEFADRSRWDRPLIDAGTALLAQARDSNGSVVLQAMIASAHSSARSFASTDWPRILELYSRLLTVDPAPGFALGRSVALSYVHGPAAGLADLDELLRLGRLDRYPYAAGARAHMLERLGRVQEAAVEWRRAAALARSGAEREFFAARAGGK